MTYPHRTNRPPALGWVIARESFKTMYGGELVTVDAGDGMAATHPIALAHPTRFEPDGPRPPKTSQKPSPTSSVQPAKIKPSKPRRNIATSGAWRAPAWMLGSGNVQLRDALPAKPARVTIASTARQDIVDLVEAAGDRETGGLLFGPRSFAEINVSTAYGPGTLARGTATSFSPDDYHDEQIRARHRVQFPEHREAGFWHLHPDGGDVPSDADMRSIDAMCGHAGAVRYLCLIVTPGERGWDLQPWQLRPDATLTGRSVIERARLV